MSRSYSNLHPSEREPQWHSESRHRNQHDRIPDDDKYITRRGEPQRREDDDYRDRRSRYREGERATYNRRTDDRDRDGGYRERPRDHERRERERHNGRDYSLHDERERKRSASPQREARSSRPRTRSQSASRSEPQEDKAKPNFGASGLLAAETNTVRKTDGSSTLLKYNEPPEARKPAQGWRLYVFKGSEQVGSWPLFLLCSRVTESEQDYCTSHARVRILLDVITL